MIKIILIFLFLFFKSFANANIKLQIIDNFKNIKNLKFEFVQKIGKKTESGDCIIDYSEKKILCKYNDVHDKVMVSNGNSLFINSKKKKQYYRYALDKTPLFIILNKKLLIKKMENSLNKKILKNSYSFETSHENYLINFYFNKYNLDFMGWSTTDIYQNKVETKISNIKTNIELDNKIFRIQKYIN
tara:strand:- start:865 stop:1425 length:561 start_codon:yes stop_codon:yes gene_type:complete